MSNPVRILIVEDRISDFELARREIARVVKNYELHQVETEEAYLEALETLQPDLILSDYSLPGFDGRTALTLALEHAPFTPLIIWTGTANEDTAVDIMKAGATNYVIKENIKRLGPAVLHALEERDLRLKRKRGDTEREALFEIMKGLADTEDLSAFLKIIHSSIARVIDAQNFMVIFYREDTMSYEAMYSVDQYDSPAVSAQLERSAAAYVCQCEEPVLLTKTEYEALIDQGQIGSVGTRPACWLGAPLKTSHGVIGVIAVQNYENPNAYSEQDKEFLAGISSQVAVAVERRQAEEVVRESQRFAESTLNALNSHIAVLDENGTIIAVNRAWREFSDLNGGDPTKTGPGVSYLAVCEAASALGTEGPLIAAAIRSVLRGDRKDYSLVYSCPSAFERRWFWVRVTAFETGGPVRIVIEHQNITERKEAELELRKSRARYQEIFDHSPVSL
ncbi:MAG TPA: response regulator, partial [Anaerolineales bacterium]|nr:response regulator [Anaerolineales bacterium]